MRKPQNQKPEPETPREDVYVKEKSGGTGSHALTHTHKAMSPKVNLKGHLNPGNNFWFREGHLLCTGTFHEGSF